MGGTQTTSHTTKIRHITRGPDGQEFVEEETFAGEYSGDQQMHGGYHHQYFINNYGYQGYPGPGYHHQPGRPGPHGRRQVQPTEAELRYMEQRRREEEAEMQRSLEEQRERQRRQEALNREHEAHLANLRADMEARRQRLEANRHQWMQSMLGGGGARNTQNNPLPVVEVAPPPNSMIHTCAICASDFDKRSSEAAYLECTHWYHYDCINEWTRKGHHTCPECRQNCSSVNKIKMPDHE